MRLRAARAEDAAAIARVHVASRRAAYALFLPAPEVDGRDLADREARWRRFVEAGGGMAVATVGGVVAGFASWERQRDPGLLAQGVTGEVGALYVAPDRMRRGLGSALLDRALGALREEGHRAASLEAYEDNAAGCAFYAARGGALLRRWIEARPDGLRLRIVSYGWGAPARPG